MAEIYAEAIGANRYAPESCANIELYGYNGAERLTVGQLVNAVVVRRCALIERHSVLEMNMIATDSGRIERLGALASDILASSANWASIRSELIADFGVEDSSLPDVISSYNKRMQAFEAVKQKIEACNSSVDRTVIELQTAVSRRDAMYNMATTICSHLGKSEQNTASAYTR